MQNIFTIFFLKKKNIFTINLNYNQFSIFSKKYIYSIYIFLREIYSIYMKGLNSNLINKMEEIKNQTYTAICFPPSRTLAVDLSTSVDDYAMNVIKHNPLGIVFILPCFTATWRNNVSFELWLIEWIKSKDPISTKWSSLNG